MGMELLFVLGLIGAEIISVTSDDLPPPHLSSPSPFVYKDQSVVLHCTAPSSYLEGVFYLYSESGQNWVQQKSAPETKHSVTFTFQPPVTNSSILYSCVYNFWEQDQKLTSQSSNIVNMTILDEEAPTSQSVQSPVSVPLWVILLVSGLVGLLVVVAFVSLVVCLIQRSKKKRQEQRDKESIWIHQEMAKDWTLSRHNKVFPMESTTETEISHPYLTSKNSYSYTGTEAPFSSFRT